VYLHDVDPSIIEHLLYVTSNNFMCRPIVGYKANKVIVTWQAAQALAKVQADIKNDDYSLVIYDSYRPQRAVDSFVVWSQDLNDQAGKALYYPDIDKADAFKLEYIAKKSGHTRGSTADLTIIELGKLPKPVSLVERKLANGQIIHFRDDGTVDMGSSVDFMGEVSHPDSQLIEPQAIKMRNYLQDKMAKHGFVGVKTEWWHFTLNPEPFPDTYFDFEVQ